MNETLSFKSNHGPNNSVCRDCVQIKNIFVIHILLQMLRCLHIHYDLRIMSGEEFNFWKVYRLNLLEFYENASGCFAWFPNQVLISETLLLTDSQFFEDKLPNAMKVKTIIKLLTIIYEKFPGFPRNKYFLLDFVCTEFEAISKNDKSNLITRCKQKLWHYKKNMQRQMKVFIKSLFKTNKKAKYVTNIIANNTPLTNILFLLL